MQRGRVVIRKKCGISTLWWLCGKIPYNYEFGGTLENSTKKI
jgi:hypothetical protein